MSDIGLFLTSQSSIDITVVDDAIQRDDGLLSAVLISLFTDRRANIDDMDDPTDDPRGWWGDTTDTIATDQIGSWLWMLLDRGKITQRTVQLVEDYAHDALRWMIDDGIADTIVVTSTRAALTQINLHIAITQPTGDVVQYAILWDAERI